MKTITALALISLLSGCATMHPPQITDPQAVVLGPDERVQWPVRQMNLLHCETGPLDCSTPSGGRLAVTTCSCRR